VKLLCVGLIFVFCEPVEQPVPAQVTVAVCPIVTPWSADYQKRLAAELRKLPSGSTIEDAIAETISLRDQARACQASNR
jgi:hypothetical protein